MRQDARVNQRLAMPPPQRIRPVRLHEFLRSASGRRAYAKSARVKRSTAWTSGLACPCARTCRQRLARVAASTSHSGAVLRRCPGRTYDIGSARQMSNGHRSSCATADVERQGATPSCVTSRSATGTPWRRPSVVRIEAASRAGRGPLCVHQRAKGDSLRSVRSVDHVWWPGTRNHRLTSVCVPGHCRWRRGSGPPCK